MKLIYASLIFVISGYLSIALAQDSQENSASCEGFYNVEMRKLRSQETVDLCQYAGKPLLVVNTASHCGYTPQFKELEAIHQAYKDDGLVVLGFPSDSFNQEAITEAEIADVCYVNYGVSFTMFEPSLVRGHNANEFFRALTSQSQEPQWNFYKYLVDGSGQVVATYSNGTNPSDREFQNAVEALL